MRTYLKWFQILLKSQLKKLSTWLLLAVMVLLVMLVHVCTLPRQENTKVLVSYEKLEGADLSLAKAITRNLQEMESVFSFEVVNSEEDLKDGVLGGKATCGIAFEEDIYNACIKDDPDEIMKFYCASFANTGEVVKETVYAAFFKEYSKILLKNHMKDIYEKPSKEVEEMLLSKAEEYLKGTTLFRIEKVGYDVAEKRSDYTSNYPVRGMIALVLFLTIFLAVGEKKDLFQKYLPRKRRLLYLFFKAIVSSFLVGAVGLILLGMTNQLQTIWLELVGLIILVICSYIVSALFLFIMRDEDKYVSLVFGLVLLNLAVCPIFFDVAQLVGAIKYVRFLFPVGIYLMFF